MSAPIYEGTTPLISDRYIIPLTAGEDLSVGDIVEITADYTVKKPTGVNSLKFAGICLTNAANGKKVTVINRGVCRVKTLGTVNAGDQLCASGGTAIADNSHKDTTIIGMAIKAAASNVCDAIIW
jgi:predicted RecA/RadA family phage recombinase